MTSILLQRLLEEPHRFAYLALFQHVGNPHLVSSPLGSGVKPCPGSEHHCLPSHGEIFKEEATEVLRIRHRQTRHEVEGALGHIELHARDLSQTLDENVAAPAVFLTNGVKYVGSIR